MGAKAANILYSVPIESLTVPTSTAQFGLGSEFHVIDAATNLDERWVYLKVHAALTANRPYVEAYGSTVATAYKTGAPVTLAAPGSLVVVPSVAFTSGYFGWLQYKGQASVSHSAETYAVGDFLQLLNGGSTLVVDGTTGAGATAISINSCAMTLAVGSTAVAKSVLLLGERAVIAGS